MTKKKLVYESGFANESFAHQNIYDNYPEVGSLSIVNQKGEFVKNKSNLELDIGLFWKSKMNEITLVFIFCSIGLFLILLSAGNIYFDAIFNAFGGVLNQGVVYIWNSILGFVLPLLPK